MNRFTNPANEPPDLERQHEIEAQKADDWQDQAVDREAERQAPSLCWVCNKEVPPDNLVELADGSVTHRVCPEGRAERAGRRNAPHEPRRE
jgi:hypothetical protein